MADGLVIDTNLLVDYRRDGHDAVSFIGNLMRHGVARVHPVSIGELLVGVRDRDEQIRTAEFLRLFKRLHVKAIDFDGCFELLGQYQLSHRVGWPDCLIAATCIRLGLPIVTINDKHFKLFEGLSVVRPY